MNKQRLSTNAVSLAIAALAVMVLIIYVAYVSHEKFEKIIISQAQQQLLVIAKTTAARLEEYVAEHLKTLRGLSEDPAGQEAIYKGTMHGAPDTEYCRVKTLFQIHNDDVNALTTLDADGVMLHRHPFIENRPGMDHMDKPGVASVVREHKPYVSEPFVNNLGNLAVSISQPVFYKDEFAGIVRWMVQADTIAERFIQPILLKGADAMILGANGVILAHHDREQIGKHVLAPKREKYPDYDWSTFERIVEIMTKGEEGADTFYCRICGKRFMAYTPVDVGDHVWSMGIAMNYSEIAGPIHEHARNTFGLAGLLILVFGGGSVAFFRVQKRKVELKAETKHLTKIAQSAEALRRSEETLRKSEAQKQAILDASVDIIMHVDKEMRIVWANSVAAAMVNKTPEGLVGWPCHKIFWNADSPCAGCPCRKALETGNIEEATVHQPAMETVGESYWEHHGVPLKDESGQVVGVIDIARNVTEKVKTEQALARAKEDWENTFDAITDMVMLLDSEHRILRANQTMAEALNTTKEHLAGKKCYELVHGQSHPIEQCPLAFTMKTLEPQTKEITIPSMGGIFICSTSPVVDHAGKLTGYTHTLKDITESKRIESRLQEAQKMEAIGTLAGGIAHDFNNLLMGIVGHCSLMLYDIDSSHPHYKRLKSIECQSEKGAALTSQLLGYARKGRYEVKSIDLNLLVEETSETFGRTRKEITIHRELAKDLCGIEADSGQIEQVLLNLYVNAADAMPGGGGLTLKTMNATYEHMTDAVHNPKPGNYVLLMVTDTGIGMNKKTMRRIFDPFFTTKEMGRGTGLGLASVYGIITGHGGYIDVTSKKGQGTTFTIYLPASKKKVGMAAKTANKIIKGTGTVLVVDDEDIVLEAGKEMLKALGYDVLIAKDGKEAIEVYRQKQNEIDLVFLDMVMPTMGGGKVYDRMKEINPHIKVLLSSGYSIDGEATEILERGCNGFIQKPFSMAKLSMKIRGILDKE